MAILANPSHFELEAQGDTEQVLVAVRYTGPNRRYSNRSAANQGLWPDYTDFIHDVWYVAFVPEDPPEGASAAGVAWFERNSNFDVAYDPEAIAGVLLDRNYLSLEPGGPIGEGDTLPDFDSKLRDALGLEDPVEAGASYEDQLRDLAGRDDEEDGSDADDPVDKMVAEHDRGELKDRVEGVREDAQEFSLRGASMEDMAEFLVSKESDDE